MERCGATYLLVNLFTFETVQNPVSRDDALRPTGLTRMTSQSPLRIFAKPDPQHLRLC
jgi:hypothetical protein